MKRFCCLLAVSLFLACPLVSVNAQEPADAKVVAPAAPPAPVNPVAPAETSTLNLAQRRAISEFMAGSMPDLLKKMREAVGFDVDVSIDWEKVCNPDYLPNIAEFWTNQYFIPMTDAMKNVGKDSMGKTALKAKLKKIHFANTKDNSVKEYAPAFENGTLTYDHSPCTNLPEGVDSSNYKDAVKAIVSLMEKNL
jgi:hypothetical protein